MATLTVFRDIKETLAVGMATFEGSIDLYAINANRPVHPRVRTVTEGKMNRNKDILSSLTINLEFADTSLVENMSEKQLDDVGEKRKPAAIFTLHAARLDIYIKNHTANKEQAIVVVDAALKKIGCKYYYNRKKGNTFTVTVHNFGSLLSIEEVGDCAAKALGETSSLIGRVWPHAASTHITACRREEEIQECAKTFHSIFSSYGVNFKLIKTYNVMCNSTYHLGQRINIGKFVKYLSGYPLFAKSYIIYDNTRKPNNFTVICPYDVLPGEESDDDGISAWRENLEVILTIKDNGNIDQSSFSCKYGTIVRNRLIQAISSFPGIVIGNNI